MNVLSPLIIFGWFDLNQTL